MALLFGHCHADVFQGLKCQADMPQKVRQRFGVDDRESGCDRFRIVVFRGCWTMLIRIYNLDRPQTYWHYTLFFMNIPSVGKMCLFAESMSRLNRSTTVIAKGASKRVYSAGGIWVGRSALEETSDSAIAHPWIVWVGVIDPGRRLSFVGGEVLFSASVLSLSAFVESLPCC